MREIKFRGRRIDNGEWVYGSLIKRKVNNHAEFFGENVCFIVEDINPIAMRRASMPEYDFRSVRVDPATVGQFTGLHDKNGKEIYEGDIIGFEDYTSTESGYYEQRCTGVVEWSNETASFDVSDRLSAESYEVLGECVVIGNIYENPELLSIPTPQEQIPDWGMEG